MAIIILTILAVSSLCSDSQDSGIFSGLSAVAAAMLIGIVCLAVLTEFGLIR